MSALEDRLHDALHATGDTLGAASPDLYTRVVAGIGDDRRRRRHARLVVIVWAVAVAVATTLVLTLTPRTVSGDLDMPWWTLEIATTAVLVAIALWLGPFIKRFGRAYAADASTTTRRPGRATSS